MRSIKKSSEPSDLRKWKRDTQRNCSENLSYENLPGDVKNAVKTSLLKEQGYLCAYTMQRLQAVDDCHIEHVQPQNAARTLDLDYGNMAACFPRDGGDTSHGYGAPIKGGTEIELNVDFVTPHSLGCEQRFLYDTKGEIQPAAADVAADKTISTLKLNHGPLVDLRHRAIETHGLTLRKGSMRSKQKMKSAAQARQFAEEVVKTAPDGRLEPFCLALAQVASSFADKEEGRAQRIRAQHGGDQ
jgi:uncharacterized protein (TIGR02646 family)